MRFSNRPRLASRPSVALALLTVASAATLAAPQPHSSWLPAGPPAGMMQYYVDASSVRSQGDLTYYRLHGHGVPAVARDTRFEAEVGVHCRQRTRVEHITTVRWQGGVRTSTAAERLPVREGSREAAELDLACQLAQAPQADEAQQAGLSRPVETELGAAAASVAPPLAAGPRWSGSGFAVARNIIVTNHHVVRGCGRVQVVQGDANYEARVLASDRASDLAALEVAEGGLLPLSLADGPRELGESVTVLGYPLANVLGAELRVATGIVSGLSGVAGDRRMLQISAPVQPGNSGGPVLDERGQVAAVVVTRMDLRMNTENVSFAVRAPVLRDFLARHAVPVSTAPATRKPPLTVAQAVRKAAPSVLLISCV